MTLIKQKNVNVKTYTLAEICCMPIKDFNQFGEVTETKSGPLIFQDNGARILGVGHLDYVKFSSKLGKRKEKPSVIYCPQFDDRLGIYCMLETLKKCKKMPKFDILLTDSEEIGQSTAKYFVSKKQYNWIFELDRMGSDVVTYSYGEDGWNDLLKKEGFKVGVGSFSDICELEKCRCKALNLGIGYRNQHTDYCHADLTETKKNLEAFVAFAIKYAGKTFPHVPFSGKSSYCERWHDNRHPHHNYGCGYKHSKDASSYDSKRGIETHNPTESTKPTESKPEEEIKEAALSPHYYDEDEVKGWHDLFVCKSCLSNLDASWLYCPYCGRDCV